MNKSLSKKIAQTAQEQKQIKLRIRWFKHFKKSKNISKTCRYFGISRQTYYKWLKRYIKYHKKGLINQSKKPNNVHLKVNQKVKRYIKNLIKKDLRPSEIKNRLKKNKKLEISYSYLQKMSAKANKK